MKNSKQENWKNRKKVDHLLIFTKQQQQQQIFSLTIIFILLDLSRVEVMYDMLSFLVADYGTTSTSLSWFIYLISKNLAVPKKIQQQLSEYTG